MSDANGKLVRLAGPVVEAVGLSSARLYNVVRVGRRNLIGEVIRLHEDRAVIQVYEDTGGLQVGSPVVDTGEPLAVDSRRRWRLAAEQKKSEVPPCHDSGWLNLETVRPQIPRSLNYIESHDMNVYLSHVFGSPRGSFQASTGSNIDH